LSVFTSNYTAYAAKKKMLRDAAMKQYLNQQQEIKHQEEVIARLKSFNREKSIKRAESREKMLGKIERVERPQELNDSMSFTLEPNVVSGNDVLTIENLSKSFGENVLFTHANFEIHRGERVAIIGNNGTGKTTLLKIINGLLDADEGACTLGAKVAIGYYDQEQQLLTEENTLFEEIQNAYPYLNNTKIRSTLAAFLFTGDDVFKKVSALSGGERGRLSLAKLILSPCNFLILDEPTNHLDMVSKEILEQALNRYTGTVLYVSHDRYFVNQTATRILELTDQIFVEYIGNYDYYLEKREALTAAALRQTAPGTKKTSAATSAAETVAAGAADWKSQKEEQARRRKRENDIRKTEDTIAALEEREKEIDALLEQEEIYTNVGKLMELNREKEALQEEMTEWMERWEALLEE
ncbi:MAG: ATP-binding cassette domain-containing protein, partial [Lachnospiraceae bacterium]|nr:ATP-binding cassette domain-containing protein [Lachnospiraceae bacterium]